DQQRVGDAGRVGHGEWAGGLTVPGRVDGITRGRAQPAAGDTQRVAGADIVDRQVGEARHTLVGRNGQRAAQGGPRGIIGERNAYAVRGGRHHVPVRVLD